VFVQRPWDLVEPTLYSCCAACQNMPSSLALLGASQCPLFLPSLLHIFCLLLYTPTLVSWRCLLPTCLLPSSGDVPPGVCLLEVFFMPFLLHGCLHLLVCLPYMPSSLHALLWRSPFMYTTLYIWRCLPCRCIYMQKHTSLCKHASPSCWRIALLEACSVQSSTVCLCDSCTCALLCMPNTLLPYIHLY